MDTGSYFVELEDGWQVQSIDGQGSSTMHDEARLTSDNPIAVTITEFQTERLVFQFDLSGVTIEMGKGSLEVGIEVGTSCDSRYALYFVNECGHMPAFLAKEGCDLNVRVTNYNEDQEEASSGNNYGSYGGGAYSCEDGEWVEQGGGGGPVLQACPECEKLSYRWQGSCVEESTTIECSPSE